MITVFDTTPWSTADHTGNGCLLPTSRGLYIFGNVRTDLKVKAYKSMDYGQTWQEAAGFLQLPAGAIQFDPAITYDNLDHIYVLGWVPSAHDGRWDMMRWPFNLDTEQFESPLLLIEGSKTRGAYDGGMLIGGTNLIVTSFIEPLGPAVVADKFGLCAFEVDAADNIGNVRIIDATDLRDGYTYGSVSVAPAASGVELYFTRHKTGPVWADCVVDIMRSRISEVDVPGPMNSELIDGGAVGGPFPLQPVTDLGWEAPTVVTSYKCRYTDDKLTVLSIGQIRYMVQAFWRSDKTLKLVPCIMFGFKADQDWAFRELTGDATVGYVEPTLSLSSDRAYLGYLQLQRSGEGYSTLGNLRIAAISTSDLSLTYEGGAYSNLKFRSLRGSKDPADVSSRWMFVGEAGVEGDADAPGLPTYVSHHIVAPIPSIRPRTSTIIRGVPLQIDGLQTYDPDQNPLQYTWSHNDPSPFVTLTPTTGVRTTLMVPKNVGPQPRSINVTLTVDDGIHGPVSDVVTYTVDGMPAPTVTFSGVDGGAISVMRNTVVTVKANVTTYPNQVVTLLWEQIDGNTMVLENVNSDTVKVNLFRAHVSGENIVLRLTVTDGINVPVVATVTLQVPAIDESLIETKSVKRSFFNIEGNRASIADRHTSGKWDYPQLETLIGSDFFKVKMSGSNMQQERVVYISHKSVIATAQSALASGVHFYSRRFTLLNTSIADADHAENDTTWVLLNDGRTLYFKSPGPDYQSDWPDAVFNFSLSYGTYNGLYITNAFDGHRVLCYSGNSGILLVQLYEPTLAVEAVFAISTRNNVLYGADKVTFVRLADVESLQSGKVLVGTIDTDNKTYETLIDLQRRRIISTWDSSSTLSHRVVTGEILMKDEARYQGRLSAPTSVTASQEPGTTNVIVSWVQDRSDLTDEYEVWGQVNNAPDTMLAHVTGGATMHAKILGFSGSSYAVRVRALNNDGYGPFSSVSMVTVL